ncbi:transposase [Actinospica robiniae]|uniref:Transposase n=1 Tax=Actinospica robiniae DSM 44927 TaxID=479430 RepID=W9DZV3_9ACTN|nr:transposase [Actinospica robiniae]ETA71130.1 Transposase [Actinospica robiniae DSM 44927]
MAGQRKYPPELRERAVAMYRAAEEKPVVRAMARQLGVHPEALREWIRKDEEARCSGPGRGGARRGALVDVPELPAQVEAELAGLRKEVMELRRANEILRAASAYFAVQLDQTGRRC